MNHVEHAEKLYRAIMRAGVDNERTSREKRQAALLAGRVAGWWHDKGFTEVKAWPVYRGTFSTHNRNETIWGIESTLVNGVPPGVTPQAVASAIREAGR